jgi:cytidyltransferase-like protein
MDNKNKTVYMSFSTDVIHGGHIDIIQKAEKLGTVIVGMLTDGVVASYRRFPVLNYYERVKILENLKGVNKVVPQNTLSYAENLRKLKPDYVVHGDNWVTGFQKPIREEVIQVLNEYGGELIEYPYTVNEEYEKLELIQREQLSIPDIRRGRLKKLLKMKPLVNVIETHSGITGLIAEKTTVLKDGKTHQFDAMWCSSLCDSTSKGKPDICRFALYHPPKVSN